MASSISTSLTPPAPLDRGIATNGHADRHSSVGTAYLQKILEDWSVQTRSGRGLQKFSLGSMIEKVEKYLTKLPDTPGNPYASPPFLFVENNTANPDISHTPTENYKLKIISGNH